MQLGVVVEVFEPQSKELVPGVQLDRMAVIEGSEGWEFRALKKGSHHETV
jgi:hypothetical protein